MVMIYPSLEEIKSYRGDANVIPVCKTVLADTETPVSAWMKLCRGAPHSFLLESAAGDGDHARYSFLGANPYLIFSAQAGKWAITGDYEESGDTDSTGALRKLLARYKHAPNKNMPRFSGGAVGYLSYDANDIFLGFYRDLIAFDNKKHQLLFISNIILDDGNNTGIENQYKNALLSIGKMEERMKALIASSHLSIKSGGKISSDFEKEQYMAAVDKCKEHINSGNVSQIVLSRRSTMEVAADPFDLYRSLRIVNPSPYMFYMSQNDTHIIGASPEMLVRVKDGIMENRPIAGTRRRGETPAEDERLIHELKNDPKELEEHMMLVDFGRLELGKVCIPATVKIDNLMRIEKYSHVIHIVSDLSGKLRREHDALDALLACFPAGTLTGTPKAKAMEIIEELEPSRRGLYGGALGYIDFSGDLDTCITIRTMFYKDGKVSIQSGAGIVADSTPEREYQETVEKASALFSAINKGEQYSPTEAE